MTFARYRCFSLLMATDQFTFAGKLWPINHCQPLSGPPLGVGDLWLRSSLRQNEHDIFSGVMASSVCANSPRPASLTASTRITYCWPFFTPVIVTWFSITIPSGVALYRDEHAQHSERYLRKNNEIVSIDMQISTDKYNLPFCEHYICIKQYKNWSLVLRYICWI